MDASTTAMVAAAALGAGSASLLLALVALRRRADGPRAPERGGKAHE